MLNWSISAFYTKKKKKSLPLVLVILHISPQMHFCKNIILCSTSTSFPFPALSCSVAELISALPEVLLALIPRLCCRSGVSPGVGPSSRPLHTEAPCHSTVRPGPAALSCCGAVSGTWGSLPIDMLLPLRSAAKQQRPAPLNSRTPSFPLLSSSSQQQEFLVAGKSSLCVSGQGAFTTPSNPLSLLPLNQQFPLTRNPLPSLGLKPLGKEKNTIKPVFLLSSVAP